MDSLTKAFFSKRTLPPQPWLCPPVVSNIDKVFGPFGAEPGDVERLDNWKSVRKYRALETLPIALLIACIILLLAPKKLEPYVDDAAYIIAIIGISGYLTASIRAKSEYELYTLEREMTQMNHKEYVNFKKKNFGPSFLEWI